MGNVEVILAQCNFHKKTFFPVSLKFQFPLKSNTNKTSIVSGAQYLVKFNVK